MHSYSGWQYICYTDQSHWARRSCLANTRVQFLVLINNLLYSKMVLGWQKLGVIQVDLILQELLSIFATINTLLCGWWLYMLLQLIVPEKNISIIVKDFISCYFFQSEVGKMKKPRKAKVSKKLGCPAVLPIQQVVKFPDFQVKINLFLFFQQKLTNGLWGTNSTTSVESALQVLNHEQMFEWNLSWKYPSRI